MGRDLSLLIKEALELPAEARSALANSILDSLDTVVDENAEAEWQSEIARRIADIDAKRAPLIPWSEARARLLAAQEKNER